MSKHKTVFLGGTTNGSTWREKIIPMLNIAYFNPVVKDWTEKDRLNEIKQRQNCDILLYTLTPKMLSFYSIAELVDDSNKRRDKTVACLLMKDEGVTFDVAHTKSLHALKEMLLNNGIVVFDSLEDTAKYINSFCNADDKIQKILKHFKETKK